MKPAVTNADGACSVERDVCHTVKPAPEAEPELELATFTNQADNRETNPRTASDRVRIENMLSATTRTQIPQSAGDEASEGGVASHSICGGASIVVGSSRVFFEGSRAAFHSSLTNQNGLANANAPVGTQSKPSQSKIFVTP